VTVLKGFGWGCKTDAEVAQLKALNLDWFYTWGDSPNLATPQPGVPEFVPMCYSGNADRLTRLPVTLAALNPAPTVLLGFNEPDLSGQAEMTTGEARRGWPYLEATGLRLGSPVTTSPNQWWMNRFMEDSTALHSPDLRIDFVTAHIYQNPHVGTFLAKIDALYDKWGKPVWVTETSVADWAAVGSSSYTTDQVRAYLAALWPELQTRPWLERFAWKTRSCTDPQMGTAALFHGDGCLTPVGELYASL